MKKKFQTLVVIATNIGAKAEGISGMYGYGPTCDLLLTYSLYDAIKAGFNKIILVVRENAEAELKRLLDKKVQGRVKLYFIVDMYFSNPKNTIQERRGIANQIDLCHDILNEPFMIINAESYYGRNTFETAWNFLHNVDEKIAIFTQALRRTLSFYGAVDRGICLQNPIDGTLNKIIEIKNILRRSNGKYEFNAPAEFEGILEDNMQVTIGAYCLNPKMVEIIQLLISRTNVVMEHLSVEKVLNEIIQFNNIEVVIINLNSDYFDARFKSEQIMATYKIEKLITKREYPLVLFRSKSRCPIKHWLNKLVDFSLFGNRDFKFI